MGIGLSLKEANNDVLVGRGRLLVSKIEDSLLRAPNPLGSYLFHFQIKLSTPSRNSSSFSICFLFLFKAVNYCKLTSALDTLNAHSSNELLEDLK